MTLTPEMATQLALMLQTGMPLLEATRYFVLEGTPDGEVRVISEKWAGSQVLAKAIERVQGKSWQAMTVAERMEYAINKHYTEMAYFLYANNYSLLEGAAKAKADTCREALERKIAGTAGTQDPLARFFADVTSGRVKLGVPIAPVKGN